ncbi:MAG: hypothetical protein ABIX46_08630 [Burkholderiaceae bacterium]
MNLPASRAIGRPLVLCSWDGADTPLRLLHQDAAPEFELVLFDYSGRHPAGPARWRAMGGQLIGAATECKGEIYTLLAQWLAARDSVPEYVALIDDDVMLDVTGINQALHIARCTGLDVFSPALRHDSIYSHRWTLHRSHRLSHPVPWVEVMMPFYRGQLFLAGAPHYAGNVSSWGIDKYLVPTLQQLMAMPNTAIVDAVQASHLRPISSGQKVYANGLTAAQEAERMRAHCLKWVAERAPHLVGSAWHRRTFEQRHASGPAARLGLGLGRHLREWLDRST